MKSTKTILKSMRISKEVYDYIENSPGTNFSEKFEHIVIRAKYDEKNALKRLENIENTITKREEQMGELIKACNKVSPIIYDLVRLEELLENIRKRIKEV